MNNPKEIIAFAMSMEKQGQKFYESFAGQVTNPEARKWFEILADTEKEHFEILEQQYRQLDEDGTWMSMEGLTPENDPALFQQRQKEEEIDSTKETYSLSDLSVLRMAYLIENDFAEYYRKAMNKMEDPEAKKMLNTLFEWENEHRRLFHDEYKKAMESNWFEQSFSPF